MFGSICHCICMFAGSGMPMVSSIKRPSCIKCMYMFFRLLFPALFGVVIISVLFVVGSLLRLTAVLLISAAVAVTCRQGENQTQYCCQGEQDE